MAIPILKILILGGTTFLGPHLVQSFQEHGHHVTIFTRGNHEIEFANVEQLTGDRDGGEILAPRSRDALIQFIDVRDLAEWIVLMVENQTTGVFNATGPASLMTFGDLLEACQEAASQISTITWVSEEFLLENEIQDWSELPLWLSSKRNMPGFLNVSIKKAIDAGLKFRPLSDTITSTIASEIERGTKIEEIGLSREKEQALLEKWKKTTN